MRLAPITFSITLALATMTSAGQGQSPDDRIAPRSTALVRQGEQLTASGQYDAAIDALESALVADPRNRGAYIALARVAQSRGLPGKAIGLYAEALKSKPDDVIALAGQGEALVQRGAVERAKLNLEKIKTICKTRSCPQTAVLAAIIAKGPPPAALATRATETSASKHDD